jgi:hypothetical protein
MMRGSCAPAVAGTESILTVLSFRNVKPYSAPEIERATTAFAWPHRPAAIARAHEVIE